jgi:hypothetical protein
MVIILVSRRIQSIVALIGKDESNSKMFRGKQFLFQGFRYADTGRFAAEGLARFDARRSTRVASFFCSMASNTRRKTEPVPVQSGPSGTVVEV